MSITLHKQLLLQDKKGKIHESFRLLLQPSSVWRVFLGGVRRRTQHYLGKHVILMKAAAAVESSREHYLFFIL